MKKYIIALGVVALSLLASPAYADYWGSWRHSQSGGYLSLGDQSDNTYRHLGSTSRYCVYQGDSYYTMKSVLDRQGNAQVNWWVNKECNGGFVRICLRNRYGETACSTYEDLGWQNYR